MTDYLRFGVGNASFPLPTSISNSSLADCDPTLYYLLDFCEGVLNYHAGARWKKELIRSGRTDIDGYSDGYIVAMKVPYDPVPFLADTRFTFPLLAMFRKSGTISERTAAFNQIQSAIDIMWILPPLSASDAEILMPFQSSVLQILMDRIEQGWDPAYKSGQKVKELTGVTRIRFNDYTFGGFEIDTNLFMPALKLSINVFEQQNAPDGSFTDLTGISVNSDLVPSDGYDVIVDVSNYTVEFE